MKTFEWKNVVTLYLFVIVNRNSMLKFVLSGVKIFKHFILKINETLHNTMRVHNINKSNMNSIIL